MRLQETRFNQGTPSGVVLQLVLEQDFLITIDDLVKMLKENGCASDTMAKIINAMGVINKEYHSTPCYAVDDLDELGKDLIREMNYYIEHEGE